MFWMKLLGAWAAGFLAGMLVFYSTGFLLAAGITAFIVSFIVSRWGINSEY